MVTVTLAEARRFYFRVYLEQKIGPVDSYLQERVDLGALIGVTTESTVTLTPDLVLLADVLGTPLSAVASA